MAQTGDQSVIEISVDDGTSFTDITDAVRSFSFPSPSVDDVEVTTFGSGGTREYIPGLVDNGEVTIETNYVPGDAADTVLAGALRTQVQLRLTPNGGTARTWNAFVKAYTPSIPLDDAMTAETVLRISREITGQSGT